jgi:hypothetical protein
MPPEIRYARSGDLSIAWWAGSGLAFAERGEHELKGVPGTWKLYAVA